MVVARHHGAHQRIIADGIGVGRNVTLQNPEQAMALGVTVHDGCPP